MNVTNIEWLAGRRYNTLGVTCPVVVRGEQTNTCGAFLMVLWENLTDPIITGREELDPTLVSYVRDLVDAAYGEENLIDLMKTRLRLDEQEARLADDINTVTLSFRAEADAVFEQAVGDLALPGAYSETASALQAAMSVSQHAAAATSHWSVQTTANTSVDDMPGIRETVAVHVSGLRNGLHVLGEAGYGAEVAHLYSEIDRLETVGDRIQDGRPELVDALQGAARQRAQMRSLMDYQLKPAVISSLDNQLYYMLTGRSERRDDVSMDSDPLSDVEFMRYWHLASVNNGLFRTFSGLIIALIMTEPTLVGEGEERFITASHRLEKSIDYLERDGGAEMSPQLVPLARQFIGLGNGPSNFFDSLRYRLPLIASERDMIGTIQLTHAGLQREMDVLIDRILEDASSSAGS